MIHGTGTHKGVTLKAVVYGGSGEIKNPRFDLTPKSGQHFVGVKLGLRNFGTKPYTGDPSLTASVASDNGEISKALDVGKRGFKEVTLKPSKFVLGRLFFEVPDNTRLRSFTFRPFGTASKAVLFKISHGKSGDTTKSTKPLPAGGTRKILRGTQPGAVITAVVYGSSGEVPDDKVPAKPHAGNHFIAVKVGLKKHRQAALQPRPRGQCGDQERQGRPLSRGQGDGSRADRAPEGRDGLRSTLLRASRQHQPQFVPLSAVRCEGKARRPPGHAWAATGNEPHGETTSRRRHPQTRPARRDNAEGRRLRQLWRHQAGSGHSQGPPRPSHRGDQVRAAEHAGRPLPRQSEPRRHDHERKGPGIGRAPGAGTRDRQARPQGRTGHLRPHLLRDRGQDDPEHISASAPSGPPASPLSSRSCTGGASRSERSCPPRPSSARPTLFRAAGTGGPSRTAAQR